MGNQAQTGAQTPPWLPNFAAYAGILPAPVLAAPKIFFTYTSTYAANFPGSGALAASAQAQKNQITIQNDAHFLIVAITGRVTQANDTTLVNAPVPILIDLSDTSGTQWDDAAVHWDNMVGTAQSPFFLPFPKLVLKGTTINIALTNLQAQVDNVRLAFMGFKLFTDWVPAYAARQA